MIVNEPHSVSEHGSIILTLNELDARAICRPLIRELRVFEHEINSPSDARDYRRGEQFVVLLAKVLEGGTKPRSRHGQFEWMPRTWWRADNHHVSRTSPFSNAPAGFPAIARKGRS